MCLLLLCLVECLKRILDKLGTVVLPLENCPQPEGWEIAGTPFILPAVCMCLYLIFTWHFISSGAQDWINPWYVTPGHYCSLLA